MSFILDVGIGSVVVTRSSQNLKNSDGELNDN